MFNLQTYEYFADLNIGLIKYLPKNKQILDIGCGQGLLGKYCIEMGQNEVTGIDNAPDVSKDAKKNLSIFLQEDITNFKKIEKLLKRKKFDAILFADVLEHLYDPVSVVNFYIKFLHSNGKVYISVPNFVVWYTRIEILFGNYTYTEAGTQEKTHIRLFTANNLRRLLIETNLSLEILDITPGIARLFVVYLRKYFKNRKKSFNRSAILESPAYSIYSKYIYPVEYLLCKLFPGLFAFQYVAIAKKKSK